jgi:large subunit ribosomal protein L21
MYAVIQTGGKQYKVKKGDAVQVELLPLEMGATTHFPEVLLIGGAGGAALIGQPFVASASVNAEVVAIEKGPKIIIYKKKPSKQNDKKTGHRQPYTRLLITSIDNGSGQKDVLSAEERKTVMGKVGFAARDAWAIEDEDSIEAAPAKKAPAKKAKTLGTLKSQGAAKAPAKKAAAKKPAAKK